MLRNFRTELELTRADPAWRVLSLEVGLQHNIFILLFIDTEVKIRPLDPSEHFSSSQGKMPRDIEPTERLQFIRVLCLLDVGKIGPEMNLVFFGYGILVLHWLGQTMCLVVFRNRIKNPVARVKCEVASHIKRLLQIS